MLVLSLSNTCVEIICGRETLSCTALRQDQSERMSRPVYRFGCECPNGFSPLPHPRSSAIIGRDPSFVRYANGTGCDAAADYAATLSRVSRAEIIATVDSDEDKARSAANTLHAGIFSSSLDDLLADHSDDFDAVLIHSDDKASLGRQAASAGKHVFIGGSIGDSVADADNIIAACESAGVTLMVGHATRYLPSQHTAKNAIASGNLGELRLVRVHHGEATGSGGSAISHVGSEIDLANWLFEALPSEVYAIGRGDDYAQVHLGYPGGGMALIDYSATLPDGGGYFSLSVIGSTGAATTDDHHNMNLVYRGGDPTAVNGGQGTGHIQKQLQEFVDAIEQRRAPSTTGTDGHNALLVAEAAS
jgi:predicted dehydrogenase